EVGDRHGYRSDCVILRAPAPRCKTDGDRAPRPPARVDFAVRSSQNRPHASPTDAARVNTAPRSPRPPRWVRALDAAALLVAIAALAAALAGGLHARVGTFTLSVRSPWRPFAWAAGLALLRHALYRRSTWWSDLRNAWIAVRGRTAGSRAGYVDAVRH